MNPPDHVPSSGSWDPFPIGEGGYRGYKKSRLWRSIRARVLAAAEYCCAGCGGKATQVHHRDYRLSVLLGEDLTPLIALCKRCHHQIHHSRAGPRASWLEEERALADLISRRRRQDPVRRTEGALHGSS